ncbi:MAG: MFS transporter [Candidatus Lokiarchaeota archaeon]|nr:MFS transporter [Candidatus Lokiarchaeota archaeon]
MTQEEKFDKRLLIIFMIQFTEVLGFSSVMPLIPILGIDLGLTTFQVGLILSIFSLCQLFASPITGKISDRFGRKPLLLFSQMSTLIGFILLGFANNVWILIAARLVDGLLGSNMTVTQAYISDVTTHNQRTKTYGYSSAVFGAGLIFGPMIGGVLLIISFSAPFFFAAGVCLLSIILVILFLPESIPEKKSKFSLKFREILPINETKSFFKSAETRGILIVFFLYSFGFFLFISTFALFTTEQLTITPQQITFYMSWLGILRVLFQSVLITPILKKVSENTTLFSGIVALAFTMLFLIFVSNYWIAFIPISFLAFGTGVTRPILTSKLTKVGKREDVGSLLGVNNALNSIAQIITPILGGAILELFPPQILPLLSAIIFSVIFILWRWAFVKPFQEQKESLIKSKEPIIA